MEGVVDVLRHLGYGRHDAEDSPRDAFVELFDDVTARRVPFADHRASRLAKILQRRPFAEELGIHGNAEISTRLPSGRLLQQGDDETLEGPGSDRGADDDGVT